MAYNAEEVLELLDDLDSNYSDDDFDGYIDDEDEEVQERRSRVGELGEGLASAAMDNDSMDWSGVESDINRGDGASMDGNTAGEGDVMVMELRVRVRVMELRERVKAETRDTERIKIHKVMVNREVRRTTMYRQVAEMEVALLESCLTWLGKIQLNTTASSFPTASLTESWRRPTDTESSTYKRTRTILTGTPDQGHMTS